MNKKQLLFQTFLLSTVLILISNCRSAPPQILPANNNVSMLGVEVSINLGFYPHLTPEAPMDVYFVKAGDKKETVLNQTKLIPATHNSRKRFYLLNAEPGRYSIVGFVAQYRISASSGSGPVSVSTSSQSNFKIPLQESTIKFAEVEVRPGKFSYLGKFYFKTARFAADDTQRHYHETFYNEEERKNIPSFFASLYFARENEKDKSKLLKQEFIEEAKKDLEGTPWVNFLQ